MYRPTALASVGNWLNIQILRFLSTPNELTYTQELEAETISAKLGGYFEGFAEPSKQLVVEGIFQRTNVKNSGRIYPRGFGRILHKNPTMIDGHNHPRHQ
jgi:hypothetical protein